MYVSDFLVQEGVGLRRILPRVLERLASGNPVNERARKFERAFDAVGLTVDWQDDREQADVSWLDKLQQLDADDPAHSPDREMSFAEVNQKRKRLTFQAFQQEDFLDKVCVFDTVIQANVAAMHRLFDRSGKIAELCFLPREPASEEAAAAIAKAATAHLDLQHSRPALRFWRKPSLYG